MSKEKEFDYVIGKLPRKDKEGNDTTGDRIGKGGRHRKDGTYSSVVEDIQIIDDPTELYDPEPRYVEPQRKRYEDFSVGEQIIIDVAGIAISKGMDFLTGWALDSFESWLNEKRRKKAVSRSSAANKKKIPSRRNIRRRLNVFWRRWIRRSILFLRLRRRRLFFRMLIPLMNNSRLT